MDISECKLGLAVIHRVGVEGIIVSLPKKRNMNMHHNLYSVDIITTEGFREMSFLENLSLKK